MSIGPNDDASLEQADDLRHGTLSPMEEGRLQVRRWTDPGVLALRARNAIFGLLGVKKR